MNLEDGLLGFVPQPNLRAMTYRGSDYRVLIYVHPISPDEGVILYKSYKEKDLGDKIEAQVRDALKRLGQNPFIPGVRIPCEECEE